MGFWLVPAALAKLSAPLIQNAYINFLAANIYLYIYAVIGTALIFMLLAAAAKARGRKQVLAAALAFIFGAGHYRHYLFPDAAAAFCLSP